MQGGKLQGVQEPDRTIYSPQNGKKTPIRQIRRDCDCKTVSPQRHT